VEASPAAHSAASAPLSPQIDPEPAEWQPRSIWVAGRLLCGAISFFFAAFVFAYFYLDALNPAHHWKIGPVHPSGGLGATIMALFLLSAVIFRLAAKRPYVVLSAGVVSILLALVAIALQFYEYTTLDFGAASGGYASVFFGWTSLYAIVALAGLYWLETQTASLWRTRRQGIERAVRKGVPAHEADLLQAGIEASSFYWAYFVAIGVLAYIVLYLV
jgi:heme/copper-type cytochrome/quinol oxidase subunit 3